METTNDATRATAEAMPTINRRRMLLGLAAASTAAATVTIESVAAPVENPKLLILIEELPALAAAYHEASNAYRAMEKRSYDVTPWAPDELTVLGTAWPNDDPVQPGPPEMKALGGFLWRKGDDFPRRIVVKSWNVSGQLSAARRQLRKAKKAGCVVDCLHLDGEIKRLQKLHAIARDYEAGFAKAKQDAHEEHEKLGPTKYERHEALEKHVAAIMDEPDFTMEGLVIKAQALAEWDKCGSKYFERLAFKHGENWHGQIAASILRHAQGGAA